jgi:hypothetical protein
VPRQVRPTDRPHRVGLDSPILLTLLDELEVAHAEVRRLVFEPLARRGPRTLSLEQRAALDRLSTVEANLEALRRL